MHPVPKNNCFNKSLPGEHQIQFNNSSKHNETMCMHEVVSPRFHNSQNENDMDYKYFHGMKFLVFVLRRGLFIFHYVKSGAFWNNQA